MSPSLNNNKNAPGSLARWCLLLVCLVAGTASATEDGDSPFDLFTTARNYTVTSKITWIPVDNIQVTCEREARIRGYPAFGYALKACTFYENDLCVIFTEKKLNMHTLGHEVRHCFQGDWHE